MIEQICDLETVKPQEIPTKVCVTSCDRNLLCFPNHLLIILLLSKQNFWWDLNFPIIWRLKVATGCRISKCFIQRDECEIFLAITYFCSYYITEEEINDLENLFYLYYLVMLLREVAVHKQNRLWNLVFPKIKKGSLLCGFD